VPSFDAGEAPRRSTSSLESMLTQSPSTSRKFAVMALVVAALGGAYLGLFSCGGYVWHERMVLLGMAVPTIAAIALSASGTRFWVRALVLSLGVVLTYRVSIAIAWPFYVGPTSVHDYVSEFSRALFFGPC
jgi:hypothetical protein